MTTNSDEIKLSIEAALARRLAGRPGKPGCRDQRADEAAFLSGACCALQAVFGDAEAGAKYIPPVWILAPLTGRTLASLGGGRA
jgi:hypothetical protein